MDRQTDQSYSQDKEDYFLFRIFFILSILSILFIHVKFFFGVALAFDNCDRTKSGHFSGNAGAVNRIHHLGDIFIGIRHFL